MRPGLRAALLLAMLPVLLLPVLGLWFVGQMADITRNERRESLNVAARNYAAALSERADLLADAARPLLPTDTQPLALEVVARAQIDGRRDEWTGLGRLALDTRPEPGVPASTLAVQMAVARSQEQPGELFLLVEARDERFVERAQRTSASSALAGDTLELTAGHTPESMIAIGATIAASQEGWFAEAALPAQTRYLRLEVVDVDYQASRKIEARVRSPLLALSSPALASAGLARLRAVELERRWSNAIRGFERAGLRVSVHDASGELLARLGSLVDEAPARQGWLAALAGRLLSFVVGLSGDFNAVDQSLSPLSAALTGVPARQSLRVVQRDGSPFWVTTSAHPIWFEDRVAGALLLEQGDGSDLASGESALQWLALLAASAITLTSLALFALTSLTVTRIRRLRDAALAAIDMRGRVVGSIPRFRWQDEVGSLASGYESVLERLREHQQYLANLRGRLVHELRTPIMVVRSSLENLVEGRSPIDADRSVEPGQADDGRTGIDATDAYVQRALGGTVRLERIVASMSEAASLESMLADSQLERVDLVALMGALVKSYETAFRERRPGTSFMLDAAVEQAPAMVVPETIAQAIDKLVANAIDFALPDSCIHLELAPTTQAGDSSQPRRDGFIIAVRNQGPPLPAQMGASLFESMVSVRTGQTGGESHLGLGLYLVRLIAEFHSGRAFAQTLADGVRVGFTVG